MLVREAISENTPMHPLRKSFWTSLMSEGIVNAYLTETIVYSGRMQQKNSLMKQQCPGSHL